jgi:putative acyl-CoA dehydrogenase
MECHGGAGYVEESYLPRLYREAPLNSIWEGSGNVICLDVLRALQREAGAADAFLAEAEKARGADRRLDDALDRLRQSMAPGRIAEETARRLVETMAITLQGSLLVRHAPAKTADAFCASRLGGDWGRTYGTLPTGIALDSIIDRAALTDVAN